MILITKVSCVCEALDYYQINNVVRARHPTCILNIIQEMVRCRRNDSTDSSSHIEDCHAVLFKIDDYVYLSEFLFRDLSETKKDFLIHEISFE